VKMVSYTDFKTSAADYDWIILACPLTDTTYKLISEEFIARLSPNTHIVNASRGDVIDEAALTDALRNNKLAGAYLDVFTNEPLSADSELWGLPNTIISPHSAGHSSGNYDRALNVFLRNVQLWAEGKALVNLAL
jgi:D-2-hydroxyacid dehydrogenase (NADP+)